MTPLQTVLLAFAIVPVVSFYAWVLTMLTLFLLKKR